MTSSTTSRRVGSLALLLPLASALSAQRVPDTRLDVGTAAGAVYAQTPEIATAGSSVYVVWNDWRNGPADVYFNRSLDGGATWLGNDVQLDPWSSPSVFSLRAKIAAEGPSVYVVWQDKRDGGNDIYFNRSLDSGTTWLPAEVRLDVGTAPGAADATLPAIAADGASVYVAWEDLRAGEYDIYFNRSLDGGATWLASDVRLDSPAFAPGTYSVQPVIAAEGSAVYVAWTDGQQVSAGYSDVYLNRSLDGGTTWLAQPVRVDVGTALGEGPALCPRIAASGSSVYVVWSDYRDASGFSESDVYFNRSLDGGATWLTSDVRLDPGTTAGTWPSVEPQIVAAGSSVYVVWEEFRAGSVADVYFNRSLDSGTTWFPEQVRLDVGTAAGHSDSVGPTIAAEGSSVYVAWEDERDDPGFASNVYYNRSLDAGATWLPTDARLNVGAPGGTGRAFVPKLAAAGGAVYATWYEFRSGSADIFFNLAAGHLAYGTGKAGSGGLVPTIGATGDPAIGGSFTIDLANGLGGASGLLLVGFTGPASIPLAGGALLISPPIRQQPVTLGGAAGVPGAGALTVPVAVPLDVALIGVRVNSQAGFWDSGASKGFSLTAGLETWVL